MLNVMSFDNVIAAIKDEFSRFKLGTELISIDNAIGRVLAEDIFSNEDIPCFRRSSLDGYAVKSSDTFGASEAIPCILELIGHIKMGESSKIEVKSGQTAYVPTGGFVPEGADGIAMIEIADKLETEILINKSVSPSTGIIFKGDDIIKGQKALNSNTLLSKKHIGALAALGKAYVMVFKKIKCGIISTGDEIVPINEDTDFAKIRDVNSHFLRALALEFGCEAFSFGICKDDEMQLKDLIIKAHRECDIVLISGGSSVGIMDFTKKAIEEALSAKILVQGIALKPGKPTIIGKADEKAVIGLPGHPVSAFFVMQEIVRCLIYQMYGVKEQAKSYIRAKINVNICSNNGRDEFLPVMLEKNGDEYIAIPIGYKSGLITLLSKADGYIKISRLCEGLDKNSYVEVYPL